MHPFDALEYAPGDTLCLVTLDGDIQHGEDKVVASRRRIDRRIDATELLRSFARTCATLIASNVSQIDHRERIDWKVGECLHTDIVSAALCASRK